MKKIVNRFDNINERTMEIIVFFLFIAFWIIRSIPAFNINLMVRYWDELIYFGYAKSFASDGFFALRNAPFPFYNVVYSVILVPVILVFQDTQYLIPAVCVVNAGIICSAIFPIYLLTRKIVDRKSGQLFVMVGAMSLPIFSICLNILIESLFIPVSFWVFWVVYLFFSTDELSRRKRIKYAILLGLLLAMLNGIKSIGIFVLLAYGLTACVDMIACLCAEKKIASIKYKFFDVFFSGVSFIFFYILNNIIVGYFMLAGESASNAGNVFTNGISHFTTTIELMYFIYAVVLSLLITILAMGYFTVVLPICFRERYNYETKLYMIFSESLLLINCFFVAFTIIICETPFEPAPVHHYRYCEHFAVNFFVLFAALFVNKKIENRSLGKKQKIRLIVISFIFCCCMLGIYQFCNNGVKWENYGLSKIYEIDSLFSFVRDEFKINLSLLVFRVAVVIVVAIVVCLFLKKSLHKIAAFIVIVVLIVYNGCTNYLFVNTYTTIVKNISLDRKIPDAITMDKYIGNLEGNILVVIDQDFSRSAILFDSYIFNAKYLTTRDLLFSIVNENGEVNLEQCNVRTTTLGAPYMEYEDLNEVDYILTDGSISFTSDEAQQISVDGVSSLLLYKINNSKKFVPVASDTSFFPNILNVGKTNTYSNSSLVGIGNEVEGELISSGSGIYIYGPYENISKGIYNVEVYYSYDGQPIDGILAETDVSVESGTKILGGTELTVDKGSVVFQFEADSEYENSEFRIATEYSGLKFEKVVITKVSE